MNIGFPHATSKMLTSSQVSFLVIYIFNLHGEKNLTSVVILPFRICYLFSVSSPRKGARFCVANVFLLRETNGYSWTLGLKNNYGVVLDVIQTDLGCHLHLRFCMFAISVLKELKTAIMGNRSILLLTFKIAFGNLEEWSLWCLFNFFFLRCCFVFVNPSCRKFGANRFL